LGLFHRKKSPAKAINEDMGRSEKMRFKSIEIGGTSGLQVPLELAFRFDPRNET